MLYTIKYKENGEEKSIIFDDTYDIEEFCKILLSKKGIKPIIEVEEGELSDEEKLESLIKAYKEFIDLPNEVIERVRELCNMAFEENLHFEYTINFILAGAIYKAFNDLGIEKDAKEIANAYPAFNEEDIIESYAILKKVEYEIEEEAEEELEEEIEEEVKEETAPLKEEIKEIKVSLSSKEILLAFLKSAFIIAIIFIILHFILRW